MNENQVMISAAMLEAMWQSRKKDMLDLITPFIVFAVAQNNSVGEEIDTKKVLQFVQEHYGYADMPESIVRKALNRNPYNAFERKEGKFYLSATLDDVVSKMEQREKDCATYLEILGKQLAEYLKTHCRRTENITAEQAIKCLHGFFERYGLKVGIEDLASAQISPKEYETDYYVSRYIFEQKDANSVEYKYLIDLVKGYFLQLAIYTQPENGNIKAGTYSDVVFYYDTPILLNLLGYCGEERKKNAEALHEMLKRQKRRFRYFPHVEQEIVDILFAYSYAIDDGKKSINGRTLEGLDQKNFNVDDVRREITTLGQKIRTYGIEQEAIPEYIQKADGTVDEKYVLDEQEMKQYIRTNTAHYTDDNLENDVASILAIQRLRRGNVNGEIEKCKFLFVTNNYDFIRAVDTYYRSSVSSTAFPLVVSDSHLSAITWVKAGEIGNLPETELLKNAYSAMQPTPEIMTKVEQVLEKMCYSGKITSEQIIALKASRIFRNEIWMASFGETESISEESVAGAEKIYKNSLLKEVNDQHQKEIEDINTNHRQEILSYKKQIDSQNENFERKRRERQEQIRSQADHYAREKKNQYIKRWKKIINGIIIAFMVTGIIGAISSIHFTNWWSFAISILTIGISVLGIKDTLISRRQRLFGCLEKKANNYETKIREKKIEEYKALDTDEDNLSTV